MRREMRESPEITSFWRFAFCFALFIALLGILPHVLFSLNAGGLHYMNNAWDEDAYFGFALRHESVIYRSLGAWLFRTTISTVGMDGGVIILDTILPFTTALLATGIAYRLGFKRRDGLFLSSCLLLFALEFLTLNNSMMVGPITQLLPSASLFYPDWIRMFTPNVYENFFNLYKSPEPQITFVVQFAALYLLLRHAQTLRPRYTLLLGALCLSFPFIYISVGISLILCMGVYAVLGLLLTRHRAFGGMLLCALAATAYYGYSFFSGPPINGAGGFIFASRLPILSLSMLWGGGLVWLYLKHWGRNLYTRAWLRECPAPVLLALTCCAVPFIALNQQLITGQMVQSRTWEGYGNLVFIALALLILWPLIEIHLTPRIPHWLKRRAPYAATALAVWLVLSQLANYAKHTRANMDNLITAELLQEEQAKRPHGLPPIILESGSDDAQVALRLGKPDQLFVAGFQQSFDHLIPLLTSPEWGKDQARRDEAFLYFDRLGLTKEEFAARMDAESTRGRGKPEVARFFAYMDCWKQLSDHRNANIAGMKEKIPAIVEDYGTFLKNRPRRNHMGEVWLATRKPHTMRSDVPWKESILATRTQGFFLPATVTIYRMTPR